MYGHSSQSCETLQTIVWPHAVTQSHMMCASSACCNIKCGLGNSGTLHSSRNLLYTMQETHMLTRVVLLATTFSGSACSAWQPVRHPSYCPLGVTGLSPSPRCASHLTPLCRTPLCLTPLCLTLLCLTPHPAAPHHNVPHPNVPCRAVPHPAMPHPAVPHPAVPQPAVPHTSPCCASSCYASPCCASHRCAVFSCGIDVGICLACHHT